MGKEIVVGVFNCQPVPTIWRLASAGAGREEWRASSWIVVGPELPMKKENKPTRTLVCCCTAGYANVHGDQLDLQEADMYSKNMRVD